MYHWKFSVKVLLQKSLNSEKFLSSKFWIDEKKTQTKQTKNPSTKPRKKGTLLKAFLMFIWFTCLFVCPLGHQAVTVALLRSRSRTRNTESIMSCREGQDVLNEVHFLKNEAHAHLDRGWGQVACFLCKNSSHRLNLIGASNLTLQLFCL